MRFVPVATTFALSSIFVPVEACFTANSLLPCLAIASFLAIGNGVVAMYQFNSNDTIQVCFNDDSVTIPVNAARLSSYLNEQVVLIETEEWSPGNLLATFTNLEKSGFVFSCMSQYALYGTICDLSHHGPVEIERDLSASYTLDVPFLLEKLVDRLAIVIAHRDEFKLTVDYLNDLIPEWLSGAMSKLASLDSFYCSSKEWNWNRPFAKFVGKVYNVTHIRKSKTDQFLLNHVHTLKVSNMRLFKKQLPCLPNLVELSLRDLGLNDHDAVNLSNALEWKRLERLSLANNDIGSVGALVITSSMKRLKYLNLCGNKVDPSTSQTISSTLTRLMLIVDENCY